MLAWGGVAPAPGPRSCVVTVPASGDADVSAVPWVSEGAQPGAGRGGVDERLLEMQD